MESKKWQWLCLVVAHCIGLLAFTHAIESPQYKIMHSWPDIEKNGSDYYVKFYVPEKYEAAPPLPSSALNLQVEKWRTNCIAVRKFSGFAKDENVHSEIEAFLTSLRNLWTGKTTVFEDKYSFTIAQYNASFHLSGRLNEVWMNVSGLEIDGCY
ncbi:SOUL heme-binding family protein [Abeliophyllum distichum]|uniref:SOUL heme-binding family protein n=1 Tax=Abeliophyllum distichum TaxID=126358 RepID=A0ABD1W101_9LAMI